MQPIPYDAGDTTGWQQIPIRASDEPLVSVDGLIACDSAYGSVMRVRQSVLERLLHAQALLPDNIDLVIRDGYRSFEMQKSHFDKYLQQIKDENPQLFGKQLEEYTAQYVSIPSKNVAAPAPHATGGAVDVMLRFRGGEYLHFGSDFDEMAPVSALNFFETNDPNSEAAHNRRLLFSVMNRAGFAAYAPEWWHYNAPETQMGAKALGFNTASFGLC